MYVRFWLLTYWLTGLVIGIWHISLNKSYPLLTLRYVIARLIITLNHESSHLNQTIGLLCWSYKIWCYIHAKLISVRVRLVTWSVQTRAGRCCTFKTNKFNILNWKAIYLFYKVFLFWDIKLGLFEYLSGKYHQDNIIFRSKVPFQTDIRVDIKILIFLYPFFVKFHTAILNHFKTNTKYLNYCPTVI